MANLKSKLSYIGSVAMAGGPEAYWRANFEPPKEERLLAYFGCHLATPVPCRRNSDRNVLVGRRIDLFLAYCLWVKWLLHLLLIGWNLEQKTKWEMCVRLSLWQKRLSYILRYRCAGETDNLVFDYHLYPNEQQRPQPAVC